MKTPEEMAEEYAKEFYGDGEHIDFPDSQTFYVAGYKAAQVELLQTISELEAQIDNLERVHGDRRE